MKLPFTTRRTLVVGSLAWAGSLLAVQAQLDDLALVNPGFEAPLAPPGSTGGWQSLSATTVGASLGVTPFEGGMMLQMGPVPADPLLQPDPNDPTSVFNTLIPPDPGTPAEDRDHFAFLADPANPTAPWPHYYGLYQEVTLTSTQRAAAQTGRLLADLAMRVNASGANAQPTVLSLQPVDVNHQPTGSAVAVQLTPDDDLTTWQPLRVARSQPLPTDTAGLRVIVQEFQLDGTAGPGTVPRPVIFLDEDPVRLTLVELQNQMQIVFNSDGTVDILGTTGDDMIEATLPNLPGGQPDFSYNGLHLSQTEITDLRNTNRLRVYLGDGADQLYFHDTPTQRFAPLGKFGPQRRQGRGCHRRGRSARGRRDGFRCRHPECRPWPASPRSGADGAKYQHHEPATGMGHPAGRYAAPRPIRGIAERGNGAPYAAVQ